MNPLLKNIRTNWFIISVLIGALILRLWSLTAESLWLDELHTMNESDPDITWGNMFFYLKCCDQHPPLHFIVSRLAFNIFGHTAGVARLVSVTAGMVSIWAIWLLGKEILNRSLGNFAAVLTAVNYYNIYYSREARDYIFAFLFAVLSFLYFIRLIKSPGRKNSLLFALFTLCAMYSHYYGMFIAMSQAVLAPLFIFQETGAARKKLFLQFLLAGAVIIVGYLPWVPFVLAMSKIESFWIETVAHDFLQRFVDNYFGDSNLLRPLIVTLLVYFALKAFSRSEKEGVQPQIKNSPIQLAFLVSLVWVFVSYLVPYLRSILAVPMLFPRYTIVVLPAIILGIAFGIELIGNKIVQWAILGLFVGLSLLDVVVVKRYYVQLQKTQFRELTQYLTTQNPQNFPVINQVTAWQNTYYMKKFGSKAQVISIRKEDAVDSILRKSPSYNFDAFWIIGAHGDQPLAEEKRKALDTAFVLLKEGSFIGAWAQFYMSKTAANSKIKTIYHDNFAENEGTVLSAEKVLAIWGGVVHAKPVKIEKGRYRLTVAAYGTQSKGVFPHLNVFVNEKKLGDYFVTQTLAEKSFEFQATEEEVIIKLDMDNDYSSPSEGDRNTLVKYVVLEKLD